MVARERQGVLSRKAWSVGYIRTRFCEGVRQLDRRRATGVLNPCARENQRREPGDLRGES